MNIRQSYKLFTYKCIHVIDYQNSHLYGILSNLFENVNCIMLPKKTLIIHSCVYGVSSFHCTCNLNAY